MLRSAVVAVLAVALCSSVAAAQTFVPVAETLFPIGASLTSQTPAAIVDLSAANYLVELAPPAAMDKTDLTAGSLFRSALSAVRAVAKSSSTVFAQGPDPAIAQDATGVRPVPPVSYSVEVHASQRPKSLLPLYAVNGAVQTLDVLSTWRNLDSGRGREANPLFKSGNHALMAGAKIGATSANVYLMEKLWKTHPVAAVALLVGSNVVMSGVVVNNFRTGL